MRYWLALAFLRDFGFELDEWTPISLERLTKALACTKRNAQFVVKKLVEERVIDWQAGVGRGNLPKLKLLKDLAEPLHSQARQWMQEGKTDQALMLIAVNERDQFIAEFVSQYQTKSQSLDILQVPFYRATHSLVPSEISRRSEHHIASYLYARLLRYNPATRSLEGDLAQRWQHQGEVLQLTLRKQLKFWDGSPLTAYEVQDVFDNLLKTDSVSLGLFHLIDEFKALDATTLRVQSKALANYLPMLMARGALSVAKLTKNGWVGSGSFRLVEQTSYRTLLHASEHYHGFRPWLDGVEIWNMGQEAKEFTSHCDIVHGSLAPDTEEGFLQKQQWEQGCIYAFFNPSHHAWMKRLKHRKWLQQQLLNLPLSGIKDDLLYRRSGGMTNLEPVVLGKCIEDIPVEGIAPLKVLTYQLSGHIETAENILETLKKAGIRANLEVLAYPEFAKPEIQALADIIVSGEVFSEHLESAWLGWLLCTTTVQACLGGKLMQSTKNQVFEALKLSDETSRINAYRRIEKALIKKGLYLPLFQCGQDMRISNKLSTMELLANGWIDFNQVVFQTSNQSGIEQ
ncbi:ABC transporter substrate-binding protein [Vibrio sp. SCSIO 43136]|uniref:ABC transporter substrate-binding protein n=1 Tax=Vibrio sp. SCSIO 43136 TaxID=2819101 RepID=UPI002075C814|nr:ABC transporter substrate-binding protein [Vibrio sp. SCSIO 43136]USD67569.1 SgrR family transcriptional regulator [Vibrio sp. SCSIO 43136]